MHEALSWGFVFGLLHKEVHVGIVLEIADPVGDASHEIRYWKSTYNPPMVATAKELYIWLAGRLIIRNQARTLPSGGRASHWNIFDGTHAEEKRGRVHPIRGTRQLCG
jgi:hypothetical protein